MEHIRQFDWCSSGDPRTFVTEYDIDNFCVTEKILRNKFYDPLISSDSEDEKPEFDWDKLFQGNKKGDNPQFVYVAGLRPLPPFPKLSSLTISQHYQCLKVLSAENPDVLKQKVFPTPKKQDLKLFEKIKEDYLKEQKEFLEWARNLWINGDCIRALRPKPNIETVYDAEFKLKVMELQSFPKTYQMVAQIPLEPQKGTFEMVFDKDLITVDMSHLPQLTVPDLSKKFNVMSLCHLPQPCEKHPCKFVLPTERDVSVLPLCEVHAQLAQWAAERGARHVLSEGALRCLAAAVDGDAAPDGDGHWTLPLSVCELIGPDGDKYTSVVAGSGFAPRREPPQMRARRAYRRLVLHALAPLSERVNLAKSPVDLREDLNVSGSSASDLALEPDVCSDDEDGPMVIDDDLGMENSPSEQTHLDLLTEENKQSESEKQQECVKTDGSRVDVAALKKIGVYNCTCKDLDLEALAPRSFSKWRVRSESRLHSMDVVVHCSHKARDSTGEVVVDVTPEYQGEVAGRAPPPPLRRALAALLRRRPLRPVTALHVRVDSQSGDVVAVEAGGCGAEAKGEEARVSARVAAALHAALEQLQALRPGRYLLKHEPRHGANALLYAPGAAAGAGAEAGEETLTLSFSETALSEADEISGLKEPPALAPVLLPWHKHREILPCAFTPYKNSVVKDYKRPVTRNKAPPQAIKYPKRKKDKKKN